VLVHRVA
jgi:hypothetical protein